MLDTIKETVLQIGEFLKSVATWFTDFIEDSIFFVTELANSVTNVGQIIGDIFPPVLASAFLGLITIVVVLRILGRD